MSESPRYVRVIIQLPADMVTVAEILKAIARRWPDARVDSVPPNMVVLIPEIPEGGDGG